MGVGLIVVLVLVVVLVFWFIGVYNGLIVLRNRVKNAWSQIDVQLKRRHDLIPNLVEICKGYMKHERGTLEAVIKARQQAVNINSDNVKERAQIENMLSQTLKSLFAVSENYPNLKANENMLSLQEELTSTENKISFARQHYNDMTMTFNTKKQQFPAIIAANMLNFKDSEFFEVENEEEKKAPNISF
ncbi:LemA family protein [bacterium]|nr:LemA family protein [bacterium]